MTYQEIIKDVEDLEGDKILNSNTIILKFGTKQKKLSIFKHSDCYFNCLQVIFSI